MGIIKSLIEINNGKSVIVRYQGGLGNQMFQYAFKLMLMSNGFKTYDDLSFYYFNPSYMPFVLNKVFTNIDICDFEKSKTLMRIGRKIVERTKFYKKDKNYTRFEEEFTNQSGWYEGYWQSYKYYKQIRKQILDTFAFKKIKNIEVQELENKIVSADSVSVHVRAGDYLKIENAKNFGGICTQNYYMDAIDYMKKMFVNPIFIVFSDDIEWAKKNIPIDNVIYFENEKIVGYEDWMDMYLMSICKGNIIANSSFSWWGAWLNENPNKKIICPQKWTNIYDNIEVCPKEWIRM